MTESGVYDSFFICNNAGVSVSQNGENCEYSSLLNYEGLTLTSVLTFGASSCGLNPSVSPLCPDVANFVFGNGSCNSNGYTITANSNHPLAEAITYTGGQANQLVDNGCYSGGILITRDKYSVSAPSKVQNNGVLATCSGGASVSSYSIRNLSDIYDVPNGCTLYLGCSDQNGNIKIVTTNFVQSAYSLEYDCQNGANGEITIEGINNNGVNAVGYPEMQNRLGYFFVCPGQQVGFRTAPVKDSRTASATIIVQFDKPKNAGVYCVDTPTTVYCGNNGFLANWSVTYFDTISQTTKSLPFDSSSDGWFSVVDVDEDTYQLEWELYYTNISFSSSLGSNNSVSFSLVADRTRQCYDPQFVGDPTCSSIQTFSQPVSLVLDSLQFVSSNEETGEHLYNFSKRYKFISVVHRHSTQSQEDFAYNKQILLDILENGWSNYQLETEKHGTTFIRSECNDCEVSAFPEVGDVVTMQSLSTSRVMYVGEPGFRITVDGSDLTTGCPCNQGVYTV